MLNVAYTQYVNTLLTIAVIILSACTVQRTLSDATRHKVTSSKLTCDPAAWVDDFYNPKFECGLGRLRQGYDVNNTNNLPPTVTDFSPSADKSLTENRILIPLSKRCDFNIDCPDGSDEYNCHATRCEVEDDFLCKSDLTCIPRTSLCDGRFDCRDKSDEESPYLYCHLKTTLDCGPLAGLIPCDGRCLLNDKICDGCNDCRSGLDESYVVCHHTNFSKNSADENQQPVCGLKQFECWESLEISLDGRKVPKCIDYKHVCDEIDHCPDASDEKFCNDTEIKACDGFALLKHCAGSEGSLCKYPNGKNIESCDDGGVCPFDCCPTDDQGTYSLQGCNPVCTAPTDRVCRWDSVAHTAFYSHGMTSSISGKSLECVHYTAFCNSSIECSNEADELLCGLLECDDPSHFHCGDASGVVCIDSSRRCDGIADCPNESDEAGCTDYEQHCTSSQFFCPYQSSNGYKAAAGRCVELQDACNDKFVSCHNKDIHIEICEGLCSKNPGFCPQNARCQDSRSGPLCNCVATGYVYDYEARQCVDFDECNANATKYAIPCDQKCTNIEGSFVCSCYPGYFLDSADNSTCVAEDPNAFMLVTDLHLSAIDLRPVMTNETKKSSESSRHLALSSSVDTSSGKPHYPTSEEESSLSYAKHALNIAYPASAAKQKVHYISFATFDYRLRIIYFADRYTNCIYKVKLPSWSLSDLVDSDTLLNNTSVFIDGSADINGFTEGMAVDYSSSNLYWIERAPFTQIHVISPDAKIDVSLVTQNLSQPREISLHTPKRLLFWVDWGTDTIEVCNFDGTGRKAIVQERIDFINSIHVDEFSDYVYFLDAKHDAIEFVRIDGTNRGYLLKGQRPVVERPFSITMFENTVYWSDWGNYRDIAIKIHKCNKLKCHRDKSEVNGTYHSGTSMHLTVIHKTLQDLQRVPSYSCLTNNGDCGENSLCLPLGTDTANLGRTHACYRPDIATVAANKTANASDADLINTDKDLEESQEKKEISQCKSKGDSQGENCLPSTRGSAELQRQSKDENFIQYRCYCGPRFEDPDTDNCDIFKDLPSWLWGIIGVITLVVATLIIVGVAYFCCVRESPRGILLADHRQPNKVSKIETLSDGRNHTNYGNPVLNPQVFANGVGTSPHPSPACEAFEMEGLHFTFNVSGVGGGGVTDKGKRLSDFQARQPQPQPPHVSIPQRTPSYGQSPFLQSIPEEELESEGDEDDENVEQEIKAVENGVEEEIDDPTEDGNQNGYLSIGKITRNYSVGGSSTTALIYPSDDEVFIVDKDENLACSKV